MATPRRRRLLIWIGSGLAGVVASTSIAGAWALDRYVVDHVEIADTSSYEAEHSTVDTATSTGVAEVSVREVSTGSGDDTVTYYVADVVLDTATTLRSAFANDQFGENIIEPTSEIAEDNDALFAINGDYYGFRDTGIVIRNGVVYRDESARQGLAFYLDGTVEVYDETRTSAEELLDDGAGTPCPSGRQSSRTDMSSTASRTSRSTPTSATTRSRGNSRAPRWVWSTTTTWCSSSSTVARTATAGA